MSVNLSPINPIPEIPMPRSCSLQEGTPEGYRSLTQRLTQEEKSEGNLKNVTKSLI